MIIESVTNTTSKTIHVINFNARRKIKVVRLKSNLFGRVVDKTLKLESLILVLADSTH